MGSFRYGNNSKPARAGQGHSSVAAPTFIDINPGLGGFGLAAETAGFIRLGPMVVGSDIKAAYMDFHGAGSLDLLDDVADLALGTLPFSMFMTGKTPDPAVTEVIVASKDAVRRGGTVAFAVKWDAALRLGVEPEEYASAVAKHFPKMNVTYQVSSSTGLALASTTDLFIMATPFDAVSLWDDVEEARGAHSPFGTRPFVLSDDLLDTVDPQEIFRVLGFPEDFHRSAAIVHDIHDLLRESVAIPHATIILRALFARVSGRG